MHSSKMHFLNLLVYFVGIAAGFPKSVPVHKLLDGNEIPSVGLGTFLMTPEQVDTAIISALDNGYRHIDTAFVYGNEKSIGNTLRKWFKQGNKREDVFITTKLPPTAMRPEDVPKALEISLNNLGLDYINMYLIHVPFGVRTNDKYEIELSENANFEIDNSTNHFAIWRALEKLVKAGKVKSIGLSNFNKTQLLRIWNFAEIKPSNLQVEMNPYLQQEELRKLCKKLGIVMTGYSPLGSGGSLLENSVVTKIAKAHNKSPAQVLLKFGLQRGLVVIPKSTNPKRIKENIDIFDFSLTKKEMKKLKALDQHGKYRIFDFLPLKGIYRHPYYPFADRIPK